MGTHTVPEQQRFLIQWFRTWSEYQKEDFTQIVVNKLNPSHFINGLLANGLQNLNTDNAENTGRKPSLFACQMKLFNEWWDSWKQEEKDAFTASLKDSDSKFWVDVEEELSGNRKKKDEEFLAIISNLVEDGTKPNGVPPDVINNQTVSNITTTTAVKVDLTAHSVGNGSVVEEADGHGAEPETKPASEVPQETNGIAKGQEPQRLPVGTGDGVLVIEEDNDEII